MRTALGVIVLVLVGFVAGIFLASETGGEVVVLRTSDAAGETQETRLWIVQVDGADYLRAGNPQSSWLVRLRESPEVEVERAGVSAPYRAELVPEMSPKVDAMIAEEYGLADRYIGLIRSEGESIAVRLDPLSP